MSITVTRNKWAKFPETIVATNTKTGEKKKYIPQRTCQRVRVGTYYGNPKKGCSLCGYGLGDSRWAYCPKCGAEIKA